jgi:hypothetical protein
MPGLPRPIDCAGIRTAADASLVPMRSGPTAVMRRLPQPETLLALAILLIGFALQVNNGFYEPRALVLVIAGAVVAAVALLRPQPARPGSPALLARLPLRGLVGRVLAPLGGFAGVALVGLAANILAMVLSWPGIFLTDPFPQDHPVLLGSLLVASGAIALMVWDGQRARGLWFPVALTAACVMGVWLIHASPSPRMDVLAVHKEAFATLARGQNPYAMTFRNIYPDTRYYAAGMADAGRVLFGFPYPPLSLLMALPGQLAFGDIRYADLAAVLIGACLIALAPRARGPAANVGPLAACLLLFTPRSLLVLEQGWTEAFAVCWLGATAYAACRAPRLLPLMLALLVSVKQHMVLAVPLALLLLPRPGLRAAVRLLWPALVLPLVFAAPFFMWNPQAFLRSAVLLQLAEPFRADSLSILSAFAARGWVIDHHGLAVTLLPLLALAAALGLVWRYVERSSWGFTAALGFTFLLLFLVSKKAFCNYYYFVIAAFAAAAALRSDEGADEALPALSQARRSA